MTLSADRRQASSCRGLTIDQFDWAIIEFVLMWAPYGGAGEEEIFPEFGMNKARFLERFAAIVRALSSVDRALLDESQRAVLGRAREALQTMAFQSRLRRGKATKPTGIGLSPTSGRWITYKGLWYWMEDSSPAQQGGLQGAS